MKKNIKFLKRYEIRNLFWENHPEFARLKNKKKAQNDYPADVRIAWVNFVDFLHQSGQISDQTAADITLG